MPDRDVSHYTAVFRLTSPGDSHRKVIKRNRQVVSCLPCRSRKLKCDRQQPCSSCVRRNDGGSCRFLGAPGDSSPGHATPGAPLPRRQMQTRLQELEELVNGLVDQSGSDGPARDSTVTAAESPTRPAASHARSRDVSTPSETRPQSQADGHLSLRAEGNEVRSVADTNYAAVLQAVRDLQGFVDTEMPDASSAGAPRDQTPGSREPQEQPHHQDKTPDQLCGSSTSPTAQDSDMLSGLPPRAECDKLLMFYFQQIYMIPIIIHVPHFQREYENFWKRPNSQSHLWLSVLFSILSTSLFQQASRVADGEALKRPEVTDKIAAFSSMAQQCLVAGDYLHGKPYSVEATLLYGMHLILQKRDDDPLCWHSIGTAVRLAQWMGYHRDPEHLNWNNTNTACRISPFGAEMRRRTWYMLEHFDLVHSFQLGVPPIIHGDHVDTRPPSNLRDEDFDETSKVMPPARPYSDFTPTLAYVYHSRLIRLFRRVVEQALAVTQPSYEDVRQIDCDLRTVREDVPPSLRYRPIRESSFADVPDIIMRRVLYEIMYLKCMCVLHRRYLTFERETAIYDASRIACRNASMRLLDLQTEFEEESGEGGRLYEKRYMLTSVGYHDFLLAAMCICLDLTANTRTGGQQDRERKVNALRRARAIRSKTADSSKEAAHAFKVLDSILAKLPPLSDQGASERGQGVKTAPARNTEGHRVQAAAAAAAAAATPAATTTTTNAASSSSVGSLVNSSATPVSRCRDESVLQRPGVNCCTAPSAEPPKSYSMEWDFGFEDVDRGCQGRSSGDPLGTLIGGDVDWNQIDSFLLDREQTAAGMGASEPAATTEETSANPREGWPYPQYDLLGTSKDTSDKDTDTETSFRTWGGEAAVPLGSRPLAAAFTLI